MPYSERGSALYKELIAETASRLRQQGRGRKALVLEAAAELIESKTEIDSTTSDHHKILPLSAKALANRARLQRVVATNPKVKEYFEQGGETPLTRYGIGTPRYRISYTKEGLVMSKPRSGSTERRLLTADTVVEFATHNIAVKRFAELSPKQLLKRMAKGLHIKYLPEGTPQKDK